MEQELKEQRAKDDDVEAMRLEIADELEEMKDHVEIMSQAVGKSRTKDDWRETRSFGSMTNVVKSLIMARRRIRYVGILSKD